MIPILFNYNATSFTTHGIGDLMETIRCESVANAEGEYELELDYPAGGEFIDSLIINNIIYAKVNDHGNYQAFRIYGVDKAINNLVTVHAQHISYDLAGVVVKAYETTTCSAAISGLKTNAVGSDADAYTITTNIPNSQQALNQDKKFKLEEPTTLRAALLDGDDSIKGCWGGDLIFDNYTIQLQSVGGADRGVLVEYGIDLIDMDQEESISEMITGVYPYWKGKEDDDDAEAEETIIYGDIQYAEGTFKKHRVIPLNVTEYYPNNTSAPSKSEINQTARDWIVANEIGQPQINLTLSYAELGKDVRLYDKITVSFVNIGIPPLGAKVISYKYDVLKERCIEVQVGNVKPSILFSLEDASRLKRGLIPPARIQNNSITSEKIGTAAVGSGNIGGGAVGTTKIAENAVTEPKIGQWAVTNDKLGPLSVSSGKIQNGAVGNVQIGNAAVTHDKIGEGEVYTLNIGDNAITSVKIKDGEVVNSKIYAGDNTLLQLDGKKIKEASINTLQIGDNAIISSKIKDGEVINSKIYSGTNTLLQLDGKKIKELSIDTAQIGDSAIVSAKIKDGEVIDGKIGNHAINYENVKDAQIDQLKLNDFSITSEKVSEGGWHTYPNGERVWIRDPAIGTDSIQGSAVVSMKIGDREVGFIKMVQDVEDGVAAVWELNRLSADWITADDLDVQNMTYGGYSIGMLASGGYKYLIAM